MPLIVLRESNPKEISKFVGLECSKDTSKHVIPYSADKHREEMSKRHIRYLSIYTDQEFSGFIILALEDNESIEFRRIVVASKGKGIGQEAIGKMEEYCAAILKIRRVWLDVFETNQRGQHIYTKLGYKTFKTGEYNGRRLLYFEKML